MKTAHLILLLICLLFSRCTDDETLQDKKQTQCSTQATIRNYSGLDGCGYVLELADGSIVEPVKLIVCGPPPHSVMKVDDPLHDYKIDGLKVVVDFEDYEGGSICMVGNLVKITCISKADPSPASE